MTHLLTFCYQPGYHELDYQPVITLIKINSETGEIGGHAVVLHSYTRVEDYILLLTIDSASRTGYTLLFFVQLRLEMVDQSSLLASSKTNFV